MDRQRLMLYFPVSFGMCPEEDEHRASLKVPFAFKKPMLRRFWEHGCRFGVGKGKDFGTLLSRSTHGVSLMPFLP